MILKHLEWLGEDWRKVFLGQKIFTKLFIAPFWVLLCKLYPDLCQKPTTTDLILLIQQPKTSFQPIECVFIKFLVIGWNSWIVIFWVRKFSHSCSFAVMSTFVQISARSEWKTIIRWSNPINSSTKMKLSTVRMCFCHIWGDWVKIVDCPISYDTYQWRPCCIANASYLCYHPILSELRFCFVIDKILII